MSSFLSELVAGAGLVLAVMAVVVCLGMPG